MFRYHSQYFLKFFHNERFRDPTDPTDPTFLLKEKSEIWCANTLKSLKSEASYISG